jgi:hypothetical protein
MDVVGASLAQVFYPRPLALGFPAAVAARATSPRLCDSATLNSSKTDEALSLVPSTRLVHTPKIHIAQNVKQEQEMFYARHDSPPGCASAP